MNSARTASLAFVLLLILAVSPAYSQTITTGDIAGVVKDASGAVVPQAAIMLKSTDTGETRTATTSGSGTYRFTFLKPGNYTISASASGLVTDTTRIVVEVGQVAQVDLIAKVQSMSQVVEVNEVATGVDAENANLTTTFSSKAMLDLPLPGGDLTTVAFTAPGVVLSTGGGYGNFSSHGLPGTSNLFTINGNDYNDAYLNLNNSGASNLLLGQNEIAEASVVQNAYSVQYGRQAGAQVNYVTKSGTNQFHGNLLYNWNGDRLNANDFFNNANGVGRPRAVSNQYGASIGGPILKNKLFFFADTEGIRYVLPSSGVVTVPSQALQNYVLATITPAQQSLYQTAFNIYNGATGVGRAVPITNGSGPLQDATNRMGCGQLSGTNALSGGVFGTNVSCGDAYGVSGSNQNKEWLMTTRVDYNINDKQKINFRYKTDHGLQPTSTNLISPVLDVQSNQPQYEGQVNHTYVFSPTMVNNFIGSVLYYSAIFTSPDIAKAEQTFPTWFNFNDGGAKGGGFYPMGFNTQSFPQGRNVGQGQLIDDFSLIKGTHTIKVGANFRKNRVSDHGLLAGTYGFYQFNSLADFAKGVTDASTGSQYFQSFTPITAAHIRLYNLGFYAQDEWAVKPNLKFTYGLRLERTANPLCVDNCFSRLTAPFESASFSKDSATPYNQSIQTGLSHAYYGIQSVVPDPRLGVVWSPGFSKGTVVRGGVGVFSDLSPGFLVSNVFSNAPFPYGAVILNGSTVDTVGDPNSAAASALNQFNAFKTGFFAGQTLAQLNSAVPGGFSPFNYYSLPSKLMTPRYVEWSFEIQQPIGQHNVFVVTYTGNHGFNLLAVNGFGNAYLANTTAFPNGFAGLPTTAPDSRFNQVTELTNAGRSNYNGLTVQFRRSFSYGFTGQINYTWSHALDTLSNDGSGLPFNGGTSLTTLSYPTPNLNYGNADYDIRHSLIADFTWDTPWKFNNKALGYIAGGWTVSSKFFFRTGTPYSVTDNLLAGSVSPTINGTILAAVTGPINHSCGASAVDTPCYTSSQFVASGSETNYGNLARNAIYGPHYQDIDTAIYKKFTVHERFNFQIGASAYNLLNHPNFAAPGHNIAGGGLGLITSTAIPPTSAYGAFQGSAVSGRVMVFTGRFTF